MTTSATQARASGGCHRCGAEYHAWCVLELEIVSAERVRSLVKSWDSEPAGRGTQVPTMRRRARAGSEWR